MCQFLTRLSASATVVSVQLPAVLHVFDSETKQAELAKNEPTAVGKIQSLGDISTFGRF